MKVLKKIVYEAKDGALFPTKEECQKYEANLPEYLYYKVLHSPDLTETGYFMRVTYLRLNIKGTPEYLLTNLISDWCYDNYGNSVDYVQGCSITRGWEFIPCSKKDFEIHKGIAWGGHTIDAKQIKLNFIGGEGLTYE